MKFATAVVLCILGCVGATPFQDTSISMSGPPAPDSGGAWAGLVQCGTHAIAHFNGETSECVCEADYVGQPPRCEPRPDLWEGCFKDNPCGPDSDCRLENGTHTCSCLLHFEGEPPNCRPSKPECRDGSCGPNAGCDSLFFQPCYCLPGFVGTPPNCRPGSQLLARCNPYPCGPNADCHMEGGHPRCTCKSGFVGAPPNCAPSPTMWRACYFFTPCGQFAECRMEGRVAVCGPCAEGYTGQSPYCYPETSDSSLGISGFSTVSA